MVRSKEKQMEKDKIPPAEHANGSFKMSFSWRAQLGAAVFMVGRQGMAGLATRIHLWGRPWTKEDPAYLWNADQWFQFAVKVVTLSVAVKELQPENLPIEPTSIEHALTVAFGPNPPDATFHLPPRQHRPAQPV
jgi:hypothetical protein